MSAQLVNLVSGHADGDTGASLSMGRDVWSRVYAIWLFVYFSCSHPLLSTVSTVVNAAFSGGLAVVTNYRPAKIVRLID